MDPKGPAQPDFETVYKTAGNPADQNPEETKAAAAAAKSHNSSGSPVATRKSGDIPVPSSHQESATPTSLGYGVRDSSKDKSDAEVCCLPYKLRFKLIVIDSARFE